MTVGEPNGSVDGRWFAVGRSDEQDPARAGEAATSEALAGDDAKLLVVFCSNSGDLGAMLEAINERSGGVPLIGCSTAGEITSGGPGDAGVVVAAFGGDGFTVHTAMADNASADLRGAGAIVAGSMQHVAACPHRVMLLLTDGLAGDQQEIVRGAYSVLGASVPLVGGCAGYDQKWQASAQLHGDRVLAGAVVAAAIGSDAPLGIGVRHGWQPIGEPVLVTRSANNRIYTLDDRPALDVYFERFDPPAEARVDQNAFTRFAATHPIGLSSRTGEPHVRMVGAADFDDGWMGFIAEVPQGRMAWFMEGGYDSVLEAPDAACAAALAPLDGVAPLGMLTFDCIARRQILGEDGSGAAIARVSKSAGGAPVAGFYTYGEIARTHGQSGFHNQTLVVLAVG